MLAMDVNDNAGNLIASAVLDSIASLLAPTVGIDGATGNQKSIVPDSFAVRGSPWVR